MLNAKCIMLNNGVSVANGLKFGLSVKSVLRNLPRGSEGSAACGRYSDPSEWQRSARDEGGYAEDIRRVPQQESGLFVGQVLGDSLPTFSSVRK